MFGSDSYDPCRPSSHLYRYPIDPLAHINTSYRHFLLFVTEVSGETYCLAPRRGLCFNRYGFLDDARVLLPCDSSTSSTLRSWRRSPS